MKRKTNIMQDRFRESAEVKEASSRHAEISRLIILQDFKKLEAEYGSLERAELELEKLEHFLNHGERKVF